MSLVKAIVDRYTTDDDENITPLQSSLGSGKMFANRPIAKVSAPYCVVTHVLTAVDSERTALDSRDLNARIQFSAWHTNRESLETILDDLEQAYIGVSLTLDDTYAHNATLFLNRFVRSNRTLYQGILELTVQISRTV